MPERSSLMESRFNYPSPRGVHVAETNASDDYDQYRPPRRNRYSRSTQQTRYVRDATWVSSPEPIPQTPHGPPTPWAPPSRAPSSPYRPASAAPPSPAPTVGEHMALDESDFEMVDYQPQRKRGGLLRSVWSGLKKLTGHQYQPSLYHPQRGSYQSQTMEMPAPLSAGSEGTQYVDPSPTDEQPGVSPYTSPSSHPSQLDGPVIPGSHRASPVPSMKMPSPRGSPVLMPSPRTRTPSATPSALRSALRATSPTPSVDVPPVRAVSPSIPPYGRKPSVRRTPSLAPSADVPPIRVVSPSIPASPRPSSRRSARAATPAIPIMRSPPGGAAPLAPAEDASQTLHEPVLPRLDTQLAPVAVAVPKPPEPVSPDGSLASTVARVRRFVAGLDSLPWVSDAQIADEYVPADNPRSRLRRRVRQGAEPSWYNPRAEIAERPAYLSEWDMWATQAAAGLWDGKERVMRPEWGAMYPRGYAGTAGLVYPTH